MRAIMLSLLLFACTIPTDPQATSAKVAATSTADFTWSCVGLSCNFDSTPHSGNIQGRIWEFGDGTGFVSETRLMTTASHTYVAAGSYAVRLVVVFRDLHTEETTHTVAVTP